MADIDRIADDDTCVSLQLSDRLCCDACKMFLDKKMVRPSLSTRTKQTKCTKPWIIRPGRQNQRYHITAAAILSFLGLEDTSTVDSSGKNSQNGQFSASYSTNADQTNLSPFLDPHHEITTTSTSEGRRSSAAVGIGFTTTNRIHVLQSSMVANRGLKGSDSLVKDDAADSHEHETSSADDKSDMEEDDAWTSGATNDSTHKTRLHKKGFYHSHFGKHYLKVPNGAVVMGKNHASKLKRKAAKYDALMSSIHKKRFYWSSPCAKQYLSAAISKLPNTSVTAMEAAIPLLYAALLSNAGIPVDTATLTKSTPSRQTLSKMVCEMSSESSQQPLNFVLEEAPPALAILDYAADTGMNHAGGFQAAHVANIIPLSTSTKSPTPPVNPEPARDAWCALEPSNGEVSGMAAVFHHDATVEEAKIAGCENRSPNDGGIGGQDADSVGGGTW